MATKLTPAQLRAESPPRARCSRCDGIYTLTHKTKQYPAGARLHSHTWNGRSCWGSPVR